MATRIVQRVRATLVLIALLAPTLALAQAVTTYHNTTLRTGWNNAETALTQASVAAGFGLQATTNLDGQVDSQPLVVPNQTVGSQGVHTVVYVATSNDTLYALDGITGAVLASRNFGTPVPQSALPGQCNNNGPTVGITSTPVIDTATGALYLVADTYENSAPVFRVHAVSLATLQDTLTPAVVTASAKLADGTTYSFNPAGSRQRAALLLSGKTLYAAFSSYCDQSANTTRGWLLGWTAATLAPLAHNTLSDSVPTGDAGYFLNSIWMSGYGPATVGPGEPVFLATSNSDKTTYGASNRDESLVKIAANLTGIQSYYTDPNHASEDDGDEDFGAGGAMLLPNQPGENTALAVAGGKSGTMFLFDRSTAPQLKSLSTYSMGGCWCGPSYYKASDGAGRIVTSGGASAIVWRVNTATGAPASLTRQNSTAISSGQDSGFFTSVSSNGTTAGTAIVWAVGRPTSVPGSQSLYAINPDTGAIIKSVTAGTWSRGNSDADTVPTVSGGHVYVATYKEMTIFGLGDPQAKAAAAMADVAASAASDQHPLRLAAGQHAIWGTIASVTQSDMILTTRQGTLVRVSIAASRAAGNFAQAPVGRATLVIGTLGEDGALTALHVVHAKESRALWGVDQ